MIRLDTSFTPYSSRSSKSRIEAVRTSSKTPRLHLQVLYTTFGALVLVLVSHSAQSNGADKMGGYAVPSPGILQRRLQSIGLRLRPFRIPNSFLRPYRLPSARHTGNVRRRGMDSLLTQIPCRCSVDLVSSRLVSSRLDIYPEIRSAATSSRRSSPTDNGGESLVLAASTAFWRQSTMRARKCCPQMTNT